MKKVSFRNDVLPLKDILYRLALRITLDRVEAEDIVQDTLMKVWARRDSWDTIDSMEAYCLTICRNISLDRVASRDNRQATLGEQAAEQQADRASSPFDRAVDSDRLAIVRDIITHLPEKQRTCVQLRDFEGRAYKDIAAVLGITEEQVKVNIFRARQAIKKKYQEYDNYGL